MNCRIKMSKASPNATAFWKEKKSSFLIDIIFLMRMSDMTNKINYSM